MQRSRSLAIVVAAAAIAAACAGGVSHADKQTLADAIATVAPNHAGRVIADYSSGSSGGLSDATPSRRVALAGAQPGDLAAAAAERLRIGGFTQTGGRSPQDPTSWTGTVDGKTVHVSAGLTEPGRTTVDVAGHTVRVAPGDAVFIMDFTL